MVWRQPGEEWTPKCLTPGSGGRLSLIVWGCVSIHGPGTLTIVKGTIDSEKYVSIIDNFLWPVVSRHFPENNFIFQDDNAPAHRGLVVKKFMEENDINVMEWPPQSPDLNIIENIWRYLKLELKKQAFKIKTPVLLEDTIRAVWAEIPLNFIQKLYESIPNWLSAVIRAKGCITKY